MWARFLMTLAVSHSPLAQEARFPMPDNDDAGQPGQQNPTDPGGPAPEATEDAEAQRLLADAVHDQGAEADDESTLDPKAKASLDKVRREASNLRKRLKELEPAARRLKDLEDKDKTENQKLADQLAELQTKVVEYEVREVRTAAAAAVGLPVHMAQFITATDPDEAKQQAKTLAEWGKAGQGQPDLRQGARPNSPAKVTGDDFIRGLAGRNT